MSEEGISEKSVVKANIAFMLKTIGAVATFTYGYVTIKNSISELENENERMRHAIETNAKWISSWKPPQTVQDTITRVQRLEIEHAILKTKFEERP